MRPKTLILFERGHFCYPYPFLRPYPASSQWEEFDNTSLAAPGALANRLQRRTARKANKANLDPPNQKSEITSL